MKTNYNQYTHAVVESDNGEVKQMERIYMENTGTVDPLILL